MYSLQVAPAGVPQTAWEGVSPDRAEVGDLWLLSWNDEALALAVISGVATTFVLAWPVTLGTSVVFAPALDIQQSPLGVPVLAWPTRETGIGMHLLHRRLGRLMSQSTMAQVLDGLESGEQIPLPLAGPLMNNDLAEKASDAMVDLWATINLNTWPWPEPGVTPFSQAALQENLSVTDLQKILGISLPAAAGYFSGELLPSIEQVDAVAEALGTQSPSLLEVTEDEASLLLIEPRFKEPILEAARAQAITELESRNRSRTEFALAARSDGLAETRLSAAIDRVKSGA
jgi:transcriptional regulator with XRE-family HTH domain